MKINIKIEKKNNVAGNAIRDLVRGKSNLQVCL